jgi:hypothetical protein
LNAGSPVSEAAMRDNEALDEFMADTADANTPRKRRRKAARLKRDQARRRAFRVLALLADLDAPQRAQVLKVATKLSTA